MSKINGPFWAVTYTTESGDSGFAGIFNEEPTDEHLRALAQDEYAEEVIEEEDDEGNAITTVLIYFDVHEVESVRDLPDLVED